MKNMTLITSLSIAIIAGSAIAADNHMSAKDGRGHHSFEELDANADGNVTQAEVDAHMQARFAKADANGDGSLSKDELLTRINEHHAARAEKFVDRMIERRDANSDGVLSQDEMKDGRRGDMFARMDADKDGAVTKEEFDAMRAEFKDRMRKGKLRDE